MDNGRMFHGGLVHNDGVSISVSSEKSGYEKQYLTDYLQGTSWRTDDVITESTITIDMGSDISVKAAVGLKTNMVSGDTQIKFQASSNNFADVHQTINCTVKDGVIFAQVSWSAYRYYRFVLQKSEGDYIEAGEIDLFSGNDEFNQNYDWNYSEINETAWITKESYSGVIFREKRFERIGFRLNFSMVTDSQKEILVSISRSAYVVFLPVGSTGNLYYGIVNISSCQKEYEGWYLSLIFTESSDEDDE